MLDNKIGNISIRCIVLFYIYKFYKNRPVSSVAKRSLSEQEVWGSTSRQGRREKIRAPEQRYDVGPLGTKI